MPETDALYRTDPISLAQRFGRRTVEQLRTGREPREAATLAFHFGNQVINARPVVVGYISPSEPYGVNL